MTAPSYKCEDFGNFQRALGQAARPDLSQQPKRVFTPHTNATLMIFSITLF